VQYRLTSTLICPRRVSLIEIKSFRTMNCTAKTDARADLAVLQIKLKLLGAWDHGCRFGAWIRTTQGMTQKVGPLEEAVSPAVQHPSTKPIDSRTQRSSTSLRYAHYNAADQLPIAPTQQYPLQIPDRDHLELLEAALLHIYC
jgi:hypothetical protein